MPRFHEPCSYIWTKLVLPLICHLIITILSWTGGWFSWTRQSDEMLRNIEKKILSCLKTAYKRFYVDIGSVVGQSDKIWTISLNDESPATPLVMLHGMGAGVALWCPNLDALAATRPVYAIDLLVSAHIPIYLTPCIWTISLNDESPATPLVMLHGMGAGVALWCPNLDALAATRPVYAIDLLGFGRSSRPKFASDAAKVEAQWVESVEEWRREVNLGQVILLGHSLGGYIATAYAMKYPERVRHLILADPWGFPEKPSNVYEKYQVPLWIRAVATAVQPLNPLWAVRAAGPAGKWLVSKTRPDLSRKYVNYVRDAEVVIPEYIYQCNSQTPSGESAFHSLMHSFGWAKNPMVKRLDKLDPALPITVLYGSRSWVDNSSGQVLSENRPGSSTYVQVINGAGHHVYLDKPELFNKFVLEACVRADERKDKSPAAIQAGEAPATEAGDSAPATTPAS